MSPTLARYVARLRAVAPVEYRAALDALDAAVAVRKPCEAIVFRLADWAVRECAPHALDAAGFHDDAKRLRSLAPVADQRTAEAAADAADRVLASYAAGTSALDRAVANAIYTAGRVAAHGGAAAASAAYAARADAPQWLEAIAVGFECATLAGWVDDYEITVFVREPRVVPLRHRLSWAAEDVHARIQHAIEQGTLLRDVALIDACARADGVRVAWRAGELR